MLDWEVKSHTMLFKPPEFHKSPLKKLKGKISIVPPELFQSGRRSQGGYLLN